MAKFTPGHWEDDAAHKHGLDAPEVCIDTTTRPTGPVAVVYPSEGIETRERLANIRLIAAAPEMYELLRIICGKADNDSITWDRAAARQDACALLARIDGDDDE